MSFETRVKAALTAIGADIKSLNNGKAANPSWSTWSPVLSGTGVTQGNVTYNIRDFAVGPGGMVDFYCKITLGSTTVMGSINYIALPVPLFGVNTMGAMTAIYNDANGLSYVGDVRVFAGDLTKALLYYGTALNPITKTVPFTWVATDSIELYGRYRGNV